MTQEHEQAVNALKEKLQQAEASLDQKSSEIEKSSEQMTQDHEQAVNALKEKLQQAETELNEKVEESQKNS